MDGFFSFECPFSKGGGCYLAVEDKSYFYIFMSILKTKASNMFILKMNTYHTCVIDCCEEYLFLKNTVKCLLRNSEIGYFLEFVTMVNVNSLKRDEGAKLEIICKT